MKTLKIKHLEKMELLDFISDEVKDARKLQLLELNRLLEDMDYLEAEFGRIYLALGNRNGRKRKKNIRSLFYSVRNRYENLMICFEGIKCHDVKEKRQAVATLLPVMSGYRKALSRASYRKTIRSVYLLIKALDGKEEKKAVRELGIHDIVEQLRLSNQLFDQEYDSSFDVEDTSVPTTKKSLQDVVAKLRANYLRMIAMIEWATEYHPSSELELFADNHDARVDDLQATLRLRSAKSDKMVEKRAKKLTEVALQLGWQLPQGLKYFEMNGARTLLNPVDGNWYKIHIRKGVYSAVLVKEPMTKRVRKRRKWVAESHLNLYAMQEEKMSMTSSHDASETSAEITTNHDIASPADSATNHAITSLPDSATNHAITSLPDSATNQTIAPPPDSETTTNQMEGISTADSLENSTHLPILKHLNGL